MLGTVLSGLIYSSQLPSEGRLDGVPVFQRRAREVIYDSLRVTQSFGGGSSDWKSYAFSSIAFLSSVNLANATPTSC